MRTFSAARVYLVYRYAMAFIYPLMFTTYAVYYLSLGLNPLQLLLVGTVLEATIFLLEVPTGVVADSYSRRLSVLIGMFVLGTAYMIEGTVPYYAPWLALGAVPAVVALLFGEFVRGIGETFMSGALEAWVTDEVGEEHIGDLFLKASQTALPIRIVGMVAGVGLASLKLNLPYVAGACGFFAVACFLVVAMPERHFTPVPRGGRSHWAVMGETFRQGVAAVRGRPVLVAILLVGVAAGAASEGYDRLWEAHFLQTVGLPALGSLKPVVWFGIFSAAGTLIAMVVTKAVRRRLNTSDLRAVTRTLTVLTGLRVGLLLSFGLAGNFAWAVASFLALGVVGALTEPLYRTWLNRNIESNVRATVLSMMSQTDALGQTAGGPIVGAVATRWSLRAAIVLAGALLFPALGVYSRVWNRDDTSEAASAD